jgi:hypothetical protein|tara:strand:- start:299 stop:520 length:222 start_codon:yes stop_codon:yes gene_type:complete
MPIARGQIYQQIKSGSKKKPKKKKFSTPGSRARAKADRKKNAIASQMRGQGGPQQKVVMRGFVKKAYDMLKGN